jgi:hypothetical protein
MLISARNAQIHAYQSEKIESVLVRTTPFSRCGLSGWCFGSNKNDKFALSDLPVLFALEGKESANTILKEKYA